jgi:hypothetical protein
MVGRKNTSADLKRLAAGRYDVDISTPPGGMWGAVIEQYSIFILLRKT